MQTLKQKGAEKQWAWRKKKCQSAWTSFDQDHFKISQSLALWIKTINRLAGKSYSIMHISTEIGIFGRLNANLILLDLFIAFFKSY